jgi:hypothetical protein
MSGTTTRRQGLAWAELLLCVAPVTVLWAMFVPAMVAVAASARQAWLLMLLLLAGGSVGLPALWSLVLPAALGRATQSLGALRAGALGLGVLACAVFLLWVCLRDRPPSEGPSAWITTYAAATSILVALHQLAADAARLQRIDLKR